jgi:hypothetical protein
VLAAVAGLEPSTLELPRLLIIGDNFSTKNSNVKLEGLANLAMKPNETTNELLTRITQMVRVIKESFAD